MPFSPSQSEVLRLAEACDVDEKAWRRIADGLSILSIVDVERACHGHEFRRMDEAVIGVDPVNLQLRMQRALDQEAWGRTTWPLRSARAIASQTLTVLQTQPKVLRMAVTGEVRRMCPRVHELTLLATAYDREPLLAAFEAMPMWTHTERLSDQSVRAISTTGLPVTLTVMPESVSAFFQTLTLQTGPTEFADSMADSGSGTEDVYDEASWFAATGHSFVPPELRDHPSLFDEDLDLVSMAKIKGCAVLHTSDGAGAFDEATMIARARADGYAWAVVACANGAPSSTSHLPPADHDDEHEVEAKPPFTIFRVPIAAFSSPSSSIVSLPFHHQVDASFDWSPFFATCAKQGSAIALSADPGRYTPSFEWHQRARAAGIKIIPSTFAYDAITIDDAILSVGLARRGGWPTERVLSTYSADEFVEWLGRTNAATMDEVA